MFNDNKPTYLHPATGTYTSLDLSICYPTLLLADWPSFKALCESEINETILKAKDTIYNFTTNLYEIAEKTIPKTSTKTKKKKKPWFNDDCKTYIQKRRQALLQFNTRPMHQNLENICVFGAKARRDSKRKSWKQYVSKHQLKRYGTWSVKFKVRENLLQLII